MRDEAFDSDAVMDAMAPLLRLDIKPEYRPGIAVNLVATARFAAVLLTEPIEDQAEPAPVFCP